MDTMPKNRIGSHCQPYICLRAKLRAFYLQQARRKLHIEFFSYGPYPRTKEDNENSLQKARKADRLKKLDAQTQAAVDAIKVEACCNRKLANKYYSMWRQCTKEKRNTAKLCDKKRETV